VALCRSKVVRVVGVDVTLCSFAEAFCLIFRRFEKEGAFEFALASGGSRSRTRL
jgi:hypothetical protein